MASTVQWCALNHSKLRIRGNETVLTFLKTIGTDIDNSHAKFDMTGQKLSEPHFPESIKHDMACKAAIRTAQENLMAAKDAGEDDAVA